MISLYIRNILIIRTNIIINDKFINGIEKSTNDIFDLRFAQVYIVYKNIAVITNEFTGWPNGTYISLNRYVWIGRDECSKNSNILYGSMVSRL